MKPKIWQITVIVAGLLVGAASIVYSLAQLRSPVQTVIHCVDVETGDVYRIDTSATPVILPARHPESGRINLVRVVKDESDHWLVVPRDLAMLNMLDDGVRNQVVDAETGSVSGAKGTIQAYRPVKRN